MFPHPYTVTLLRDQRNAELLRQAATARLIASASSADPAASTPSAGRSVRAYARQILASLAGVAFTSDAYKPAGVSRWLHRSPTWSTWRLP